MTRKEKYSILWEGNFYGEVKDLFGYVSYQSFAAAVVSRCDCIVSWNFKHIANIKTIRGVRAITNLKGYKPIEILSPSVLLESEEEYEEAGEIKP